MLMLKYKSVVSFESEAIFQVPCLFEGASNIGRFTMQQVGQLLVT